MRAVLARGPDRASIRTLAPTYARAKAAPLLQLAPAPRVGADTRCILQEFGLSDVEIESLMNEGIASEGYSPHVLPE